MLWAVLFFISMIMSVVLYKEDGIDPFSEKLAYLVGDIGLKMFPIAKKFLCEHCREELNY